MPRYAELCSEKYATALYRNKSHDCRINAVNELSRVSIVNVGHVRAATPRSADEKAYLHACVIPNSIANAKHAKDSIPAKFKLLNLLIIPEVVALDRN